MFGFRLLHWGPLIALSIIGSITSASIVCHREWWPLKTTEAWINIVVFLTWNVLTLYNFFRAAFRGPGLVPIGWKPEVPSHTDFLQYCQICESFKTPRSHHCRKCQRCVMKMDHHCPWINNCVGHRNQANFIAFLFFAPCGCFHAVCILAPALYRSVNRNYYVFYGTGEEPLVSLGVGGLISAMLSIGLALGVVLAVGGLLALQMLSVMRNETGIESWIKDKAEYREHEVDEEDFVYPYNVSRWSNIRMVLHLRDRPRLNGIWWPVREGCHQYTLTIEQIKQKQMKRCRSVVYEARLRFSGGYCPCTYGIRVCCCPPCLDEQRVKLQLGDRILVSRFRKHWLYGDKFLTASQSTKSEIPVKRERGWFPRRCAVKISYEDDGVGPTGDGFEPTHQPTDVAHQTTDVAAKGDDDSSDNKKND